MPHMALLHVRGTLVCSGSGPFGRRSAARLQHPIWICCEALRRL